MDRKLSQACTDFTQVKQSKWFCAQDFCKGCVAVVLLAQDVQTSIAVVGDPHHRPHIATFPGWGSAHFCPNVAISFFSFLFPSLCELLKALVVVWHRVGQTLLALWRGMNISSAALWGGIQVSAGEGWGISSLPTINTEAFSAQLQMLQARSEMRRCSAIWVVSTSGMVACLWGKGNGLDGSKLPADLAPGLPLDCTNIQTCWLNLELNLHFWSSCIVCMYEWLSFPPRGICWVASSGASKHVEQMSPARDFRDYITVKF